MATPESEEKKKKCRKLIKAIVIGTLLALAIVGYHLYQYLRGGDEEITKEHDVRYISKLLYKEELTQQSYLNKVNIQGRTKVHARDDRAPKPLLEPNDELLEKEQPSLIMLMKRLFDNYELDARVNEVVTAEEKQEELDFLEALLKTPIMEIAMNYLHSKGVVPTNPADQLQFLKDLWFTQYSRGQGRIGSSGFEHVFLAEIKDQTVLGLHNWIYFSEQEKQGKLDYKGYIERLDFDKEPQHLLALRFTFHGLVKPYNSLFIGSSPELEFALYTICFLLSEAKPCPVRLGNTDFHIIIHPYDWRGKKTIGSAYPAISICRTRSPSKAFIVSVLI